MGKIIHGNSSFGFAPIENGRFGTPVMLPMGLVSTSVEVEQESTPIYADNIVWANVKGAKVRSATASFRNIPVSYLSYLGFKLNDNGMVTDTGTFPSHCIFFETQEEDPDTGVFTQTLHYLYNVQGSEPSMETSTDEDSVEAREIEIEYTCTNSPIAVDDDGKNVQYGELTRTTENASVYDTFKTTVLLPNA